MSYITKAELAQIENLYGKPVELQAEFAMAPDEFNFVRSTQKHGREHDITLFIFNNNKLLFIAKHPYPDGLYRAPSGAAKPGEGIVEGARREAYEETGAEIELEKYLAKIKVRFFNSENKDDHIKWISYVFKARYLSGDVKPNDKHEIKEAKFIDPNDIPKFNETMRKSSIGGFHYRAFLTENVMKLLEADMDKSNETESKKD